SIAEVAGAATQAMNTTVRGATMNTYLCPSESGGVVWTAGTDYGANYGPQYDYGNPGQPQSGAFVFALAVKIAEFTDGLSNTAAVLEVVRGDNIPALYRGDVYDGSGSPAADALPGGLTQYNTFMNGCLNLRNKDTGNMAYDLANASQASKQWGAAHSYWA